MRLGLVIALTAVLGALTFAPPAQPHRARCHQAHTCPSDHATYRWKGWLCVAPYSDQRTSSFSRRITYAGRTYYCKR